MVFDDRPRMHDRPGRAPGPGMRLARFLTFALALAPSASHSDTIRAGYFYSYMSPSHLDSLAAAGLNQGVIKCIQDSLGTRGTTELGRFLERSPGLGVEVVPEWSLQAKSRLDSLATGRRYTWGPSNTIEANVGCPLDSLFWGSTFRDRALEVLAAFPQVGRLVVDLEIYTGSLHHYDKGPCRCAMCLAEFDARPAEAPADLETFQEARLSTLLEGFLRDIDAARPGVAVGFFDLDYASFVHRAMVKALVRTGVATANYTERTYSRGAAAIAEARAPVEALGLTTPLVCGLKFSSFTAPAMGAMARTLLDAGESYFLFTTYSLWQDPAKLAFPYLLASGTPSEYWAALAAANLSPSAAIAQPSAGVQVRPGDAVTLAGTATDPREAAASLVYHWEADLLDHGAVAGSATADGATASFPAATSGDGTGLRYSIRLIVTNSQGWKDTATCTVPVLDTTPPVYTSAPTATAGRDSATVQWTLGEAGAGRLSYGLTTSLGSSVATPSAMSHVATMRGLARGTRYYFQATSTDAAGNAATSAVGSFTTTPNRVPVAVASGTPLKGLAPLTVAFSSAGSSDPDGDALTYSWTFGDGTSATGASVSHKYANAGTLPATLTVKDGYGGTSTSRVNVTASPFPYAGTLDNFNRSNGALKGSWAGTPSALAVKSNVLVQTSATTSAAIWNGATYGTAQEAFVTLTALTSTSTDHDLLLKCQGTVYTSGAIQVRYDAKAKSVIVATIVSGGSWVTRGTIAQTFVTGNQLGARAFVDGTVEVYRSGAKIGAVAVTAWPHYAKGGRIGLLVKSATTAKFDNFGGGDIPAPAVAATSMIPSAPGLESATADPGPESLQVMDEVTPANGIPAGLPARIELSSATPTPSPHGVRFDLALPRGALVAWRICDAQGRGVWSESREFPAGRASLVWSGRHTRGTPVEPGVYFAQVDVGSSRFRRRVVVIH